MRALKNSVLLFILFIPALARAQQVWNLKACMDYALKNHSSVRVSENNEAIAQAQVREARSAYLPSVTLSGSVVDNVKPQVSVIPAGPFSPTDIKVAFTKQYNTTATGEVTQAIYDQAALTGLKAGKFTRLQAEMNTTQNKEAILYNVSVAYYQVYVYGLQLELLTGNRDTYAEQIRISQLEVQKGVAPESDMNKIKVNYNNTLSDINEAQRNYEFYQTDLKRNMGFPLYEPMQLDSMPIDDPAFDSGAVSEDSLDLRQKTEYRLSEVNASLLDINARQIRAGAYPQISAYARRGVLGFGDEFNQAFKGLSDFTIIGINLKVPLFTGFKRQAQYTQAKYKRLNALENARLDRNDYAADFKSSRTKMLQSHVSVLRTRENIALATQVFESTNLQYQKGVTDLTDWLIAQNALREAQANYLNALLSYLAATIDLEKSKGTLINYYNSL